jgi:hypothetical protein
MDFIYKHGTEQELMEWNDCLEEHCKEVIYKKKDVWFSQELDNHDIDRLFSSVTKTYMGGTMLMVRGLMDKSKMSNTLKCELYNESEEKINNFETITPEHDVIPLVWLEGLRFTPNSIDIVLKVTQMMVLNLENTFRPQSECLIKHSNNVPVDTMVISSNDHHSLEDTSVNDNSVKSNSPHEDHVNMTLGEISELPEQFNESIGLSEVNISLHDENDVLLLRKPNEVYEELYKSALEKARNIKLQALTAYLEAKNIKTNYMLDYMEDIDDEYENLK